MVITGGALSSDLFDFTGFIHFNPLTRTHDQQILTIKATKSSAQCTQFSGGVVIEIKKTFSEQRFNRPASGMIFLIQLLNGISMGTSGVVTVVFQLQYFISRARYLSNMLWSCMYTLPFKLGKQNINKAFCRLKDGYFREAQIYTYPKEYVQE